LTIVPALWELNYSLRKIARKNYKKMRQQLLKIARKMHCFLYIFRIYSLKIFEEGGLGAMTPSSPSPDYAPTHTQMACIRDVTLHARHTKPSITVTYTAQPEPEFLFRLHYQHQDAEGEG